MSWAAASRNLGLLCIAAAGFIVATGLAQSADWADDPAPAPSSSPSPSGSAAPGYPTHGGPIAIGLTGNIAAGQSYSGANGTTESDSTSNAGAVLTLSRHTPDTSTILTIPGAIGAHGSNLGQGGAEYDTVHQSFFYGPQQVGAIGLVPAGATVRGPAVLLPRKHGDLTLYGGAVPGAPSYIVKGARLRTIGKRGVSTLALYDATAKGGGRIDGALFGLITPPARISSQFELGVERTSGFAPNSASDLLNFSNGLSYAAEGRLDDGGTKQYASLTFRDLSPNFASLSGVSEADEFAGLSYRATLGKAPYTLAVEEERTGSGGALSNTESENYSLIEPFGARGSASFTATNSIATSATGDTWSGTTSFSFSLPFKAFAFALSGGLNRTTESTGSPNAGSNLELSLGRAFGAYSVQATASLTRSSSESSGTDTAPTLALGVARTFGKTSVAVTTQAGRTFTSYSALGFVDPTISVARRLSPVITLTTNAALQFRRDPLQPSVDGRSVQFSFALGAPFSIGNGAVSGRANPHLPGTISGVVQQDYSAGFIGGASAPGSAIGASNIAVVLDGQRVVRTDVQGRFTFNFLPAGSHTISIDPTSLPRGTQPANPVTTINLQGGQTAQIVLGIGAYGSILGSIIGGDAAGTPIGGVAVLLDDKTRSVSDTQGNFGFGGLSAGPHTVTIIPETFPANFGLAADTKQKVTVVTGESARVSFVGAPLGSIGGTLTYDSGQDDAGKGVSNAYVVANPGDHAGITDDSGSYLLDNLPPGDYTLSVDPETLGEGLSVTSDAQLQVHLSGAGRVTGQNFRIGEGEKGVVFTFNGSETNIVTARALTTRLPPGASTQIVVKTSQPVTKVTATVFGVASSLVFHTGNKSWIGDARIPAGAKPGPAAITIDATGKSNGATDVQVTVDPSIPIVTLTLNPAQPQRGQYVHVRAHFLVDAKEGDKIIWQDGSFVILPKPRTGRYFEFDAKVTSIPFRGALLTATGQLPLTLVH